MSTIEKAAAKLAAQGKTALGQISPEFPPSPPTPTVMGKAQGFITATPERFCDIDWTGLAEKGYVTPGEGRSQLAQELRRIKRPLLLNIQKAQAKPTGDPSANLIMLTSSLPGEGKTFLAINLAISLAAELDRRVLLVDADVSKGGMTEQLSIQAHRGLSDLLYETNYVGEDAVLTSNVERLSVLPAGGNTDQIDELFASDLFLSTTRQTTPGLNPQAARHH